uniref:J domain-containing protein n=1 Tax=viral metagenome TaxID=1070528 RepID=A0A6C0HS37_9ZZZZ
MNDLNIDNYTMDDILKLFKITDFNENEMKQAKKMVLMTHPDKSRLPSEYFFFYTRAYKILYSIYQFKNKMKMDQPTEYIPDKPEKDVSNYLKNNKETFGVWFNEEFEKRREQTDGYEDWLKSDDGIIVSNVKLAEMHNFFEEQSVTIKSEVKEYSGNINQTFETDIFSSLHYSDLKEAHTLAPVSMNEFYNKPKYTINQYKTHRQEEEITHLPYDEKKANSILFEKNRVDEEEAISRAYYYAKKTQESEKANEIFLAKMKLLNN